MWFAVFSLHRLVSAQFAWNLNQGDKNNYYPQFFDNGKPEEWVELNQAIPSSGKTGLDHFHVPVWYKDLKDYNFKCVFKWPNCLYCWKLLSFTVYSKIETSQKDLRRCFHIDPKVTFALSCISPPLPGDQGRFHELWVHPLHGWKQFEVQLFHPTAAPFIISVNMDCSWTRSR